MVTSIAPRVTRATLVLVVLLVTSCGSAATVGDGVLTVPTAYADVRLAFSLDGTDQPASVQTVPIACDASGALLRGARSSAPFCKAIVTAAGTKALHAPMPQTMACTMIYGGPSVIRMTGTIAGEPIDEQYTRVDGCQIARWETLFTGVVPAWVAIPPAQPATTAP
jgi:hypothetical protein